MALADIESNLTAGVPHRTCAVCYHMAERGEEWAEQLRGLLRNRGIQFKALAKELREDPDEPEIEWQALSRHAREGCSAREKLR
jgi:hypothetical protein